MFNTTTVSAVSSLLCAHKKKTAKHLNAVKGAKNECMRGLVNIGEGKTEAEQSILFGLSALSNVIPDEGSTSEFIQVRPDALICEIDQLLWGRTIGYGEVKLAEPTTGAIFF
ncbi:hypothetical protein INT45_000112, partial [Circinella minor]